MSIIKIFVKAKPRAKENKIEEIDETHFKVLVVSPPVKGLANKEIIGLLADYFDVSKSEVKLISGFSSKNKNFEINK